MDESSGRFLDLVGGDYFDLTRREGTKARCSVTLTGKAGDSGQRRDRLPHGGGTGVRAALSGDHRRGRDGAGELEAAEVGSAYNIQPDSLMAQMYVSLTGLESYKNSQGREHRQGEPGLYTRLKMIIFITCI